MVHTEVAHQRSQSKVQGSGDDHLAHASAMRLGDQLNGARKNIGADHVLEEILCEDLTEKPPYDHHWFCRPQFPCLAWSSAYHDTHTIGVGETFRMKHSLGIVNGFWTKEKAQQLWMGVTENV